jgi:PAS domain S-box-containing protein
MKDGTLDNQDISPEIVRQIDGKLTNLSPCAHPDVSSPIAKVHDLYLVDGRAIRRFVSPISYENGSSIGTLYAFEDVTDQTRAQEKIQKSNERYKELADALPQIVFEIDLRGNVTYTNRSAFKLMGFTEGDLDRGLNAIELIAPEDRKRARDYLTDVLQGEETGSEYKFVRKDGSRMPVIVNTKPICRSGKVVGFRGIVVDITEQKKTEEQIRASLREKEVLLKEIHHRVRNNLQVISSLLSLQMAYAEDFVAAGMLRESQSRIRTIALVHEKLYGAADLARVEFMDYLLKLGDQLAFSNGVLPGKVKMIIEGDGIAMEPDVVVPCGLIMSELITDSMKRAAACDSPDRIEIAIYDGEPIRITYTDNYSIEPARARGRETEKFSRQLVNMLVEQLNGTFGYDVSRNAVVIEFPAKKKHV